MDSSKIPPPEMEMLAASVARLESRGVERRTALRRVARRYDDTVRRVRRALSDGITTDRRI